MSKKQKRQRVLTNREFEDPCAFEFIEMEEIDGREYFYWRAGQTDDIRFVETDESHAVVVVNEAEACFPVCVEFVKERFIELGREYRPSGKEAFVTYEDLWTK